MTSIDLGGTLKVLKGERVRVHSELAKLDKAIAVLRDLAGTEPTSNGHPKKWTMSAAGRRKIAKGQKLRWAKIKQQKKVKA